MTTFISFEEASRCPRCDNPGDQVAVRNVTANDGSPAQLFTMRCMNGACSWFETDWLIQRLSDGTVPVREVQERAPKTFPAMPGMTPEKARKQVEAIQDDEPRRR